VSVRFEKDCERRKLRLHFVNGDVIDAIIIDVADADDVMVSRMTRYLARLGRFGRNSKI
jgi:hypothetical protein